MPFLRIMYRRNCLIFVYLINIISKNALSTCITLFLDTLVFKKRLLSFSKIDNPTLKQQF